MKPANVKKLSECYIYSSRMTGYREIMLSAIKDAERMTKNTQEFVDDVLNEVKRTRFPQYSVKILSSKNTVLLKPKEGLPKIVKVFVAKDPKDRNKVKAFIDCTNVINQNDNTHRYNIKTDTLLAYIASAKTNMVYFNIDGAFTKNSTYMLEGARIYAKLFTHVIDYIANITVIPGNRDKMMYYAAKFFLINVMQLKPTDTRVNDIAAKAAGLKDTETRVFDIVTEDDDFSTLPLFIDLIKVTFKLPSLDLMVILEKWMFLYGSGTVLGIEFLPAFITIITDAYLKTYLNNQNTIEKVIGKDLVAFGTDNIYNRDGVK